MKRTPPVFVFSLWLVLVSAAMAMLAGYSSRPGAAGAAPPDWPGASAIPRASGLPTLIVFAHPRCPCTRATLGELARLMARCQGRLAARVEFLQPAGLPEDWAVTDLWRTAEQIPGVTVARDLDGSEAKLFHAETSGAAVLYDVQGHRLFQGGLTFARGHEGDSDGTAGIASLVHGGACSVDSTPVYGCSIFDEKTGKEGAPCRK
jgi:hypothetical protein